MNLAIWGVGLVGRWGEIPVVTTWGNAWISEAGAA